MYTQPIPHDWHGQYPLTDLSRWRLEDFADGLGDHNWTYLPKGQKGTDQRLLEKYWIGEKYVRASISSGINRLTSLQQAPTLPKAKSAFDAAKNGYTFYKNLQAPDGHWPGEYSGPHFLLPGYVIGSYVTKAPIKEEERVEMIRWLFNHAHKDDGGWGMYVFFLSVTFFSLTDGKKSC